MANLLDLTSQGDVATISDESRLGSVKLMTPRELYRLWERQNWSSHEIDFTQDKLDWAEMGDARDEISWGLANFFVGEERVATQFSGLVMAYDDQHEEAFLTTQQVDEARHAQHFNNLYEQVLAYDGSFEDRLAKCRAQLNEHYIELFDGHLVEANRRLIENPRDVEAKIDFVVTYHMVIEGTLALTGQYFQTDWMERRGVLPGHLEGFRRISQDEHRHVAYGTWYLKQVAADPGHAKRIQDRLMATLPSAAGVLVPPGFALGDDYEYMGYTSQEMNEFAFTALTRRLKVIGVALA
jgi:ribonucleoside-diphosphate reductase beta chain